MKHIPANHRGDDSDTIGTCAKDLQDMREAAAMMTIIENKGFQWALHEIKKVFDEAAKKREESSKQSVEEAHEEYFKEDNE